MGWLQQQRLSGNLRTLLKQLVAKNKEYSDATHTKFHLVKRAPLDLLVFENSLVQQENIVGDVLALLDARELSRTLHKLPRKHWGHQFIEMMLEQRSTLLDLRQNLRDQREAIAPDYRHKLKGLLKRERRSYVELRTHAKTIPAKEMQRVLFELKLEGPTGQAASTLIAFLLLNLGLLTVFAQQGDSESQRLINDWKELLPHIKNVAIGGALAVIIITALRRITSRLK